MSGLFRTWDEIADYITNTKGLKYLDNPKSWVDAFRDTIKGSRLVVTDTGNTTYFNPNGWIGVGESNAPSLTTGLKNPPSVNTVVTDAVTGGAVVGADAIATEQLGMTITLTGAGVIATCLVAFGIGVASYELSPEFWTDMSNAMFEPITGHHLTYQETEPFLRKKINTWLSTDEHGKPLTYVPEEIIQRGYDFLKQHLVVAENQNNFPSAQFNPSTGECTGGSLQALVLEKGPISLEKLQNFANECAIVAHEAGYHTAPAVNVTDLYNQMQSELDLSSYDIVSYQFKPTKLSIWNNGFKSSDRYPCCIGINAYRCNTPDTYVLKTRETASGNRGYNYKGTKIAPLKTAPDISASMYFYTSPEGAVDTRYSLKQNAVADGLDNDIDVNSNVDVYVGYYVNNPPTGINGLNPDESFNIKYNAPLTYETATTDEYLQRNNVKPKQGARVPDRNKSLQERYPGWYSNVKVVSYPDKNKTQKQTRHLPATTPIGDTNTDKILKHGVNNDDNNSYKENQDDNQTGKNTPNISSPDDINISIEETKKEYNEHRITPESLPDPVPEIIDLPDYPDVPEPPTPDTPEPPAPPHIIGVTASGMVSVYNPTKQQLIDFSAWLWSPSFLDNFLKIFANPMDAIIGLHIMYATPVSSGSEHIIAGYLDSNVSSKVVTKQYSELDCGTIAIPECYGNATDYEPYTTIHIYLPFIGIMPLKTNDVMGKQLKLKYGIDALTGTCLAMLTVIKDTKEITNYTFAGNCAVQIPVSGGNYAQMITGLAGFIVAGAGAIASGNPILALGAGASFMSGNVSVQHSGSIGANAGACGIRTPYLIISRKKAYDAQNYQHYYGFPANQHVKLSSCKGYTQVKSCHVESIYRATDNEKKEIESLLKEGVIII